MNCCNSCSDFWGADADVSVKDAWYKWSKDKESKNIVVIRNPLFENILRKSNIQIYDLSVDDLKLCQIDTIRYKQKAAIVRAKKDITKWNDIDLEHRVHHYVSEFSKKEYKRMVMAGYNNRIINRIDIILVLLRYNPIRLFRHIFHKVFL